VLTCTHATAIQLALGRRRALCLAAATAEIAGNAVRHAGGAVVELEVEDGIDGPSLVVRVVDRGPGIEDVDTLLGHSAIGDGDPVEGGLRRARRLVERLVVASSPGDGTTVVLAERLPPHSPGLSAAGVAELAELLGRDELPEGSGELVAHELLAVLDDLARVEREAARLRREAMPRVSSCPTGGVSSPRRRRRWRRSWPPRRSPSSSRTSRGASRAGTRRRSASSAIRRRRCSAAPCRSCPETRRRCSGSTRTSCAAASRGRPRPTVGGSTARRST
jgi:anti-sigma regulatory factor (Ser/Thr protein kinase)